MKKLVLTLALIFCGYSFTNASIISKQSVELSVGSNPVAIVENPIDGVVNIFCAGIDANGNNIFDEAEDEKPSWWQYDPSGSSIEPSLHKEFDDFFVSPFKPSVDTLNGYSMVVLPFAANKSESLFTSNGYVQGLQMKSGSPAFKIEAQNGEYLFYQRQLSTDIIIVRANGNDSLKTKNKLTQEVKSFELEGDASDFSLVDLNFDNEYEIAILIDNKRMNFIQFKDLFAINSIAEIDFEANENYTGSFGHFYSKDNYVYTTFPDSETLVKVSTDLSGNNELITTVFEDSGIFDFENIQSNYPLSDEHTIITSENNNVIVVGYTDIPEMHRTNTSTGLIYATSAANAYITGENKVFKYIIENNLNIDENRISKAFTKFQPMDIFKYDGYYLNLNLGIDFNFDFQIDKTAGDQKASIGRFNVNQDSKIEPEYSANLDFDFPINFPLNTNITTEGNLPIPSQNKVYFYNAENNNIYDSLKSDNYISCSFSVLDYIVLGEKDLSENKSYIRIINEGFIDVSTEVGANVLDCIVYQNSSGFGVVSLSEGNFGKPDSKINVIKLSTMGIGDNTPIEVGTGGSSIVANSEQTKAAIVMNGSHEIHILNLLTGEIDLTFSTGTTGFGGPRDAEFYNDKLYVTTYSNQIIVFDANTGQKIGNIVVDGHTEGIVVEDDFILAANINYGNYEFNNRLMSFKHPATTYVIENTKKEQAIRVYPNPVVNDFHLVSDDLAGFNNIAIINSEGKIVATHSGTSKGAIALNADALGLVAGNYTAIINGTRAVRFIVMK